MNIWYGSFAEEISHVLQIVYFEDWDSNFKRIDILFYPLEILNIEKFRLCKCKARVKLHYKWKWRKFKHLARVAYVLHMKLIITHSKE